MVKVKTTSSPIAVMSCLIGIRIIVWIYLLNITGVVVRGQSGGPNAVVIINGKTTLDCNTANLASSNWIRTSNGTSDVVAIAFGCSPVTGGNATYYGTEVIGGSICRLTIANVTMQQAGVYACFDGITTTYRSLITIIDPVASVVVYNRSEVVEGDQLNISCSINYNGPASPAPLLRPSPYWTTSPGQIFTNATHHTSTNVVNLIAIVTVQKYTVPIFHCNTVFEITESNINYNATAPADNLAVGNSKELDVQYPVEAISIHSTSKDDCISKQETLTCTASANPPAQYVWLDLKNNITTTGANKSISSGGEYQCIAYHSIRNQTHNATENSTQDSCHSPYNLTINGTGCANNFCTCNGNDSYSESITITCMANGIPIPSVKWRNASGEYTGPDFVVTHNGNYTCIATNTYGGNPYSKELTVVVSGCLAPPAESTTTHSTTMVSNSTTSPPIVPATPPKPISVGAIVGMIIGVFVIANIVATGLFFWYYKKVEVSHSGKIERNNKLRLDRRFTWLKKMFPCVSDTKESAGSNCLWVSLFILLGTVTGIVTFPIWIILAKKYEKNNETSALNRSGNGEGNGIGENGRRPASISSANHSQQPPANQMNAIRREDPYQNESSRENIELNNSLRSRNLLLSDSQPSKPPPAGRPPPPPNKPTMNTGRSKDYSVNDETPANPEHTTYADLPFVPRNTLPTATPVQFLNVSNDTYAALNKT